MNITASYASEVLIGPPSQHVAIRRFIDSCSTSSSTSTIIAGNSRVLLDLFDFDEEKHAIHEECNVADLKSSLDEILSDPFRYSYLTQSHEDVIEAIRTASKTSRPKKRQRTDLSTVDETHLNPEVAQLRNNLENIALSCWSYPTDAALFTRSQKNSDLNTLTKPKSSLSISNSSPRPTVGKEAILIVSVYNRLSWGNQLSRSSQHVVLASQTIGDLYDVIPCPSNEIPSEIVADGGYNLDGVPPHRGAVVYIEGFAHGDGQAEEDYSDKLVQQIELLPEKKRLQVTKGTDMYSQQFKDLSLRLNQPYWLLHQGTCEHFLVIDCIRILHPDDPLDDYPLTLHISPPIIDLCMACSRVPAILSLVGDIRLGQSPFEICRPCWSLFGEPNAQDKVLIVPLPKYEHGW